jgi:hypothetical protein
MQRSGNKVAHSQAAGEAMIAMTFLFSPVYNVAFNTLIYSISFFFPFCAHANDAIVYVFFLEAKGPTLKEFGFCIF